MVINVSIITLADDGWAAVLLHFSTARRAGRLRHRPVPSSLTSHNSPPINGQCTNFILFDAMWRSNWKITMTTSTVSSSSSSSSSLSVREMIPSLCYQCGSNWGRSKYGHAPTTSVNRVWRPIFIGIKWILGQLHANTCTWTLNTAPKNAVVVSKRTVSSLSKLWKNQAGTKPIQLIHPLINFVAFVSYCTNI